MHEENLYTISFEIRKSLTAICCYSAKLCRDGAKAEDDVRNHWCDIIKSACHNLADDADRMLIASKLGNISINPGKDRLNLGCFVNRVMSVAEVFANESSDIIYCSSLDQDFEFCANAVLLETALVELLKNALQNITGGHVILRVGLNGNGASLYFSVSDSGPGISPEHRGRIFDWFYKADPYKPGLGIGLPLCREIVTQLGGEVFLDEHSFSGTKMLLTIPVGEGCE